MGCCNEPVRTWADNVPDPTQHVNFTRGMVLGVDDFTQEFAYLSGRDRWLVRDALGYGTVSGLRVHAEDDGANGPRVHVDAGTALVPGGHHVCVAAHQCCSLDQWLARDQNADAVTRLLAPGASSPPPREGARGWISLYLTLSWHDCQTLPVPIPGEPCRDESELMAPSRVADDHVLELRSQPPQQTEEDALRDFVCWLQANVREADASPPPAAGDRAWLQQLRVAAQPWLDAADASPPAGVAALGDYLKDLPEPRLDVPPGEMARFLRVAQRFWVTELRPLWTAMRGHRPVHPERECLLLARLRFEVVWVGGSPKGRWQVAGSWEDVEVDEATRPVLLHLRLLQEWLVFGPGAPVGTMAAAPSPTPAPQPAPVPGPPRDTAAPRAGALRLPVTITGADLALDASHHCVVCRGAPALTLTLPASTPETAGQLLVVKNVDVPALRVVGRAGESVEEKPELTLRKRRAVTLIADGAGRWNVISAGTGHWNLISAG